jgi:hypothetical protein
VTSVNEYGRHGNQHLYMIHSHGSDCHGEESIGLYVHVLIYMLDQVPGLSAALSIHITGAVFTFS